MFPGKKKHLGTNTGETIKLVFQFSIFYDTFLPTYPNPYNKTTDCKNPVIKG